MNGSMNDKDTVLTADKEEMSTLQRFRSSRLERERDSAAAANTHTLSARGPMSGRGTTDPNDPFAPFFDASSTADKGRVRL